MNPFPLVLLLCVVVAIAIPSPVLQAIRNGINPCEDIEDPLQIEPGAINITVNPFLVIEVGSEQFGAVVTGLSGLVTELSYHAILQQISFKVTLPNAHIVGDQYVATGAFNATPFRPETLPSGPFTGDGKFEASVNDFVIEGKLNILMNLITNLVSIRSVTVTQLTFSKLFAELGGFVINCGSCTPCDPFDFEFWNAHFKTNFDVDFAAPAIKNEILEKVKIALTQLIGPVTVAEFLEIINKPAPTCPPSHQ